MYDEYKFKMIQKEFFREEAHKFKRGARTHLRKLRCLIERLGVNANDAILELGCGNGLHAIRLEDICREYYGIDISSEMIESARSACRRSNFIVCDAEHLPLQDRVFDKVFCVATLHHLPRPLEALKEGVRVLKKGGVIGVAEPNPFNPVIFLDTFRYWKTERKRLALTGIRLQSFFRNLGLGDLKKKEIIFAPSDPKSLERIYNRIDLAIEDLPILKHFGVEIILSGTRRESLQELH